jgi:hypothetical protein
MSSHLICGCTLQVAAHDRFISMINDKSVYKNAILTSNRAAALSRYHYTGALNTA